MENDKKDFVILIGKIPKPRIVQRLGIKGHRKLVKPIVPIVEFEYKRKKNLTLV